MTKFIVSLWKILLSCLLAFILILSGFYAFFEFYFKDNWARLIKEEISKNTGLSVNFTDVKFSFLSFLKLNPSLVIKNIEIGDAVSVDKFYIEAQLKSLLKRKLLVESLLIDKPVFSLIENEKREVLLKGVDFTKIKELLESNQDELEKEKDKNNQSGIKSINLDSLKIKNADIVFEPHKGDPLRFRNLNLTIKDILISDKKRDKDKFSTVDFSTNFFDKGSSRITFHGELETIPLDFSALNIKGQLKSTLNLSDLPKKMLDSSAKLLAFNNSLKHVNLNAYLKGNLLDTLYGSGTLNLDDFRVGASKKNLIKISSHLNLNTAMNFIKNPQMQINISQGKMKIDSVDLNKTATGNLNFSLSSRIDLDSLFISVNSAGALTGLKIHELIHAFDPKFKAPIEGVFEIPAFKLSFAGKSPEQQVQSLKATGSLNFKDASIPMILDLKKKKEKVMKFLPLDTSKLDKALEGNFLAAKSDFNVTNKLIKLNNLIAESKYASLKGAGSSDFKGYLNFDLDLTVPERLMLMFNVHGDSKKPKVKINDFQLIGSQPLALPSDLGLRINREPMAKAVTQNVDKAVNRVNTELESIPLTDETKAKAKKGINKLLDLGAKYGVYTKPNPDPTNRLDTENTAQE